MQQVKCKDSEIELLLRKALWKKDLRYRKNVKSVFGHPDIAFIVPVSQRHTVIAFTPSAIAISSCVNSSLSLAAPDIAFIGKKVAVFCDSEFWHGYDWERRKEDFKVRQDFWIPKIERNNKTS